MSYQRILQTNKPDSANRPGVGKSRRADVSLPASIFPQLDRLYLTDLLGVRGSGVGQRNSQRLKPAADFYQHRAYVPGDDIRYVDWRASARQDKIFVRQGQEEQGVNVHLLLDTSASMAWGTPAKNYGQLQLAAMLGYLSLSFRDRLYVLPYGKRPAQLLGPISGKKQWLTTFHYLRQIQYGGESNLLGAMQALVKRSQAGGIVYILSDLLSEEALVAGLDLFPRPRWQVRVFHTLHDQERNPKLNGSHQLVDSETGVTHQVRLSVELLAGYHENLDAWVSALEFETLQQRAGFTPITTNETALQVLAQLRVEGIVTAR